MAGKELYYKHHEYYKLKRKIYYWKAKKEQLLSDSIKRSQEELKQLKNGTHAKYNELIKQANALKPERGIVRR